MTSRVLFRAEHWLKQAAAFGPVLGLDTGTPILSLALVRNGQIVRTISGAIVSHGATLPGAVDELLGQVSLRPRDLSAIAVGTGPGSFTGLRIGISYAKGLAMASGCALAGVPSFDAAALAALEHQDVPAGSLICTIADARKGEVYAALYRVVPDGLQKLSEELVIALEHLASRIAGDVLFVGDSKAKDAAALMSSRGLRVAVLDTGALELRGALIAAIGGARLSGGENDRAASLEPLYVRTPEQTFKPLQKNPAGIGTEALWSIEKKNSFGSI